MSRPEIDTTNYQLVGVGADGSITVQLPRKAMTKDQALTHAAWLVALASDSRTDFDAVLAAVRNT